MKTKLAKETRLNQSKTDLINELLEKNEFNIKESVVGCGLCWSEEGGSIYNK